MEKLVLIDGNAIMHRAFHALPPLNSSSGEMVNAVYGFFSMFLKILQDLKPTCIAVCFDRAAPTFRKVLYAGYQAKRPQMDDGLSLQFGIVHSILEKAGIAIFEVDGYEADDLIGTLSVQAVEGNKEREVIIVSGDRDLLQLVNSHVKMYAPVTGLTNTILYDVQKVVEKFGILPSQIIDYKALIGDSSDNYPGVSGIGPKTAADLLNTYGSFENLYQRLGELQPKISERLATDAEQASLAKKLATIDCRAPVHFDKKQCLVTNLNKERLIKSFQEFGFNSLLKRYTEENASLKESKDIKKSDAKEKDKQLRFL